jgi:hypothetical protein
MSKELYTDEGAAPAGAGAVAGAASTDEGTAPAGAGTGAGAASTDEGAAPAGAGTSAGADDDDGIKITGFRTLDKVLLPFVFLGIFFYTGFVYVLDRLSNVLQVTPERFGYPEPRVQADEEENPALVTSDHSDPDSDNEESPNEQGAIDSDQEPGSAQEAEEAAAEEEADASDGEEVEEAAAGEEEADASDGEEVEEAAAGEEEQASDGEEVEEAAAEEEADASDEEEADASDGEEAEEAAAGNTGDAQDSPSDSSVAVNPDNLDEATLRARLEAGQQAARDLASSLTMALAEQAPTTEGNLEPEAVSATQETGAEEAAPNEVDAEHSEQVPLAFALSEVEESDPDYDSDESDNGAEEAGASTVVEASTEAGASAAAGAGEGFVSGVDDTGQHEEEVTLGALLSTGALGAVVTLGEVGDNTVADVIAANEAAGYPAATTQQNDTGQTSTNPILLGAGFFGFGSESE